ncbi:MAG: ABC transporter permease [Acidimicrobiia bacterium]
MRRLAPGTLRVAPVVVVIAVVAAVIAALPLVYLVVQASSRGIDNLVDEIWQRRTLDLTLRSLALASMVTVCSLGLGIGGAFAVVRTHVPLRRVLTVLLVLPLAMPSYVAAYAWISWIPALAGFWGAVLVITSISFPFVLLPVAASLRRLDSRQEEVARSLGLTPARVTVRLTLRHIRPAATAGGLMVGLYALSDFGAVATMRFESFTWVIFGAYRAGFNPTRAAVLSLVLVVISVVLVWSELYVRGDGRAAKVGGGVTQPPPRLDLGRGRVPVTGVLLAVVAVTLVIPAVLVVRWFVEATGSGVEWGELASATAQTILVAVLATIAVIVLAVPTGVLAARVSTRWARATERTVFVIHALPGVVIGLSVVYLGIRLVPSMYQRMPMLVFAYVVLFTSLAVGSVRSAVELSPTAIEDSARSLGLSRFATLRRVMLPLARPGITAGAALVFLTVMKELPATILLRPTGMETLATELWTRTSVADYAAASPYALVLVLVAAVPAALLTLSRETQ